MDRSAASRRRLAGAALALGLLAGCAPHVELAPTPPLRSTEWQAAPAAAAVPRAPQRGLAESLGSPLLEQLVARALAANADIGVAAARIERARADLRIAKGEMLPVVS